MKTLAFLLAFSVLYAGALGAQSTGGNLPEFPPDTSAPAPNPAGTYQPKSAGDKAHSEAEFTAIAYLNTLARAQHVYFHRHQQYASSLAGLAGTGSFTKRMAIPNRGDYVVAYRAKTDTFSAMLTPKVFDAGHRSFYVDESGKIRVEEAKAATQASPLLQ